MPFVKGYYVAAVARDKECDTEEVPSNEGCGNEEVSCEKEESP